jgi:hypothetical protein
MIEQAIVHEHRAVGIKVKEATVAPEHMHFHITSHGVTASAPNRPGHRHALRTGGQTHPAEERWQPSAIGRL